MQPIRKRMRRREVPGTSRFVTFSCQRRLPLLSSSNICEAFLCELARVRRCHQLAIFAWVLMPEHVHLLCRTSPGATLEHALRSVKISIAKRALHGWQAMDSPILARLADATGRARFWQKGGGFDRNVRDESEFCRHVRYIHRNPVERGLVGLPQDWPWSSVRWWMGARSGEFECDPPPGRSELWLGWKGYV